MQKLPDNLDIDWSRRPWFGNPDNQYVVARFRNAEFFVGVSCQSFTCPRFRKNPHFGKTYPFLALRLGDDRKALTKCTFLFRSWDNDGAYVRKVVEAVYRALCFCSGKVIGKRPKESERYLNAVANAAAMSVFRAEYPEYVGRKSGQKE